MKVALNLASRRYVNRRAISKFGTCVVLLLLILVAFQLRGYLQGRESIGKYEQELTKLQQNYRALLGERPKTLTPQEVEEQTAMFRQAEALLARDAFRWTALFDRLEALVPGGISITAFNPDYQNSKLDLSGYARDLSALQKMLNRLHEGKFEQVFLQSQSQIKVKNNLGEELPALSFQIKLEGVF